MQDSTNSSLVGIVVNLPKFTDVSLLKFKVLKYSKTINHTTGFSRFIFIIKSFFIDYIKYVFIIKIYKEKKNAYEISLLEHLVKYSKFELGEF